MNKAEYNEYTRQMRALSKSEYKANPVHCLHCGKLIEYENRINRFCNRSCSASFNNRGLTRNPKKLRRQCKCGNIVSERHNKWCDECIKKGVYNKKVKDMSLEEITTDRSRRLWMIRKYGHRCQMCGLTEWLGSPITLELDHIDGNSDHNYEENLRILCPNCHSTTPFWKGKVTGKEGSRQKNRRKRYANGQTW